MRELHQDSIDNPFMASAVMLDCIAKYLEFTEAQDLIIRDLLATENELFLRLTAQVKRIGCYNFRTRDIEMLAGEFVILSTDRFYKRHIDLL